MTGEEFQSIRDTLKMDRAQFARLIGYTGLPDNDATRVKRYENGERQVPLYLARYLWLIQCWLQRTGDLPDFPEWPGYDDYDHSPDPGHIDTSDIPEASEEWFKNAKMVKKRNAKG